MARARVRGSGAEPQRSNHSTLRRGRVVGRRCHVVEPRFRVVHGNRSEQREEGREELVGALQQQVPRAALLRVLSLLGDGIEGVHEQRVAGAEVRDRRRGLLPTPPFLPSLRLGPPRSLLRFLVAVARDPKSRNNK